MLKSERNQNYRDHKILSCIHVLVLNVEGLAIKAM